MAILATRHYYIHLDRRVGLRGRGLIVQRDD